MVNLLRSRWAAVGAAVAVTLGGGGLIGVSAADTSSTLVPIAPVRVLDTRASDMVGDINDGASITVQVTGSIATVSEGTKTVVPSGASAITGNMTLVSTTSNDYGGFATIYPCGTRPDASNINFTSGQTVANSVAVPLSASGTVCIYVFGTAHVLLDVSGYYTKSEISDLANRVTAIEEDTTVSALAQRVTTLEDDQEPEIETSVVYDPSGTSYVLHRVSGLREMEAIPVHEFQPWGFVLIDDEYWAVDKDNVQGLYAGSGVTTETHINLTPFYYTTSDCSGTHYVRPGTGPSGNSGPNRSEWIAGELTKTVTNYFADDTYQSTPIHVRGIDRYNSFEVGEIFALRGDPDNIVTGESIGSMKYYATSICTTDSGYIPVDLEYMPVIATKVTPDIQFPLSRARP